MPRGNATGPMGMGPGTGRGAGFCTGATRPGYMMNTAGPGRGMGFGPGRGRGCGFGLGGAWRGRWNQNWTAPAPAGFGFGRAAALYNQPNPELEKQTLKYQAEALQSDLEIIRKRLNELETGSAE